MTAIVLVTSTHTFPPHRPLPPLPYMGERWVNHKDIDLLGGGSCQDKFTEWRRYDLMKWKCRIWLNSFFECFLLVPSQIFVCGRRWVGVGKLKHCAHGSERVIGGGARWSWNRSDSSEKLKWSKMNLSSWPSRDLFTDARIFFNESILYCAIGIVCALEHRCRGS